MAFPFDDFVAFGGIEQVEETGEATDAHDDRRIVLRMFLCLFKVLHGCHVPLEDHCALLEHGLEFQLWFKLML